eukprot:5030722-Lingulodinium_polyedra.AAC.1
MATPVSHRAAGVRLIEEAPGKRVLLNPCTGERHVLAGSASLHWNGDWAYVKGMTVESKKPEWAKNIFIMSAFDHAEQGRFYKNKQDSSCTWAASATSVAMRAP